MASLKNLRPVILEKKNKEYIWIHSPSDIKKNKKSKFLALRNYFKTHIVSLEVMIHKQLAFHTYSKL